MAVRADADSSYETQQRIIADIRNRTGHLFPKIESIDTSSAVIANAVLPVLADWVELTAEENIRHAIYSRFSTPHAAGYVELMLGWARQERDDLARGCLVQAIAKVVRPQNAVLIWSELKKGKLSGFDAMLMAKMTAFPSVTNDATEALVAMLKSDQADVSDLQYIAKVKDPRILEWFKEQIDSPDKRIRTIANRVVGRSMALPDGLHYAVEAPDRGKDMFSTETDIDDLDQAFTELRSRFGVKVPTCLSSKSGIWNRAEVNSWIKTKVELKGERTASLWLRLEDIDVIEVVLSRES